MPSPHRTREIAKYEATHTLIKSVTSGTTALTAAESGKYIAADITGGNVILTLPAAEVGLTYRMVVHKSDAGNDEFNINTAASGSHFKGGVNHSHDGGDNASVEANGTGHYQFSAVDAEAGTDITVVCDGTHWYITGVSVSTEAPTFA
tara:strand:+ start:966 stop:1409 length:444 start_codon:yes stop_codon:yes gene_type:complete